MGHGAQVIQTSVGTIRLILESSTSSPKQHCTPYPSESFKIRYKLFLYSNHVPSIKLSHTRRTESLSSFAKSKSFGSYLSELNGLIRPVKNLSIFLSSPSIKSTPASGLFNLSDKKSINLQHPILDIMPEP